MKIMLASDHAGIELREEVYNYLLNKGYDVEDLGTHREKANYAVEGIKVSENIAMGKADFGIAICGTGIGISIAANKVNGVRCALCHNVEYAKLAREHNDANIVAIGARFTPKDDALQIVDTFLNTNFAAGRHENRVDTITDYEESCIDC